MTYAIAAAGTGGHVYPGLAVAEALVASGVDRASVLFVGGSRLESTVYPKAGFSFLEVELRGLKRSFDLANLGIPLVVLRAARAIAGEFRRRAVGAVLGMGGYVTIPAAMAARRCGIPLAVAEQNAHAGLANRIAGRFARHRFVSFEHTVGLEDYEWTGNPIRARLASFDRTVLRARALEHYGLSADLPVVGVFGGSLGAGAINDAVVAMMSDWGGPSIQLLHLAGEVHADEMRAASGALSRAWRVVGFEQRMELFFAASDLVVARAGGAVAEIIAARCPSVLIPGAFGSGGHQRANAAVLERAGAAVIVDQDDLERLGEVVAALIEEPARLAAMGRAAQGLARPEAAARIAARLREMHG